MSLRLRAVLIAGIALVALWAVAAASMIRGVQANLDQLLDERLAMSARMVSGLLQRTALTPDAPPQHWADVIRVSGASGIACEVRSLQGTILAQTEGGPYSTMDSPPPGYSTREVDGEAWRLYVLDDARGYQVMTADRVDRRGKLTRAMLHATGIPFAIAVAGGLIALWIGIGRGLAPLDALRQTLARRRADATRPLEGGRAPRELEPVIGAMNDLLARLARALAAQRAFTDAAAHELRTPLTAIDTHLQVARMTHGAPAQAALSQAGEGVRRLRHTLEQMMLLARSDAPAADDDACTSVCGLIDELLARCDATARARITFDAGGADCASTIPRSMLASALGNLIDNALRYSPQGSSVSVTVRRDAAARRCLIDIADRGPGLAPEQVAHLGQRFWRGDQGRSQGDGAGLGLSIVQAISTRFGGTLRFHPREGGGLVATLALPLA